MDWVSKTLQRVSVSLGQSQQPAKGKAGNDAASQSRPSVQGKSRHVSAVLDLISALLQTIPSVPVEDQQGIIREFSRNLTNTFAQVPGGVIDWKDSTQEAAQVTQLLAKQLLRELGLSEDLEVIQKTGNSPLVSEDAVLDIAQTLQALEIIAGSKAQSVYQTLLELRLSDVLNMLLHHLIHSRTPFLTQNLSRILRPLTNLYAALFEIPALGRLGHFEFLHETLSGLDYSDSYSLQIGHGISKILIALGRSPAFGQDLISAFHEAHLMRTLVSSVQNSIDLNNVQKAPLLLTLILQLLKGSIVKSPLLLEDFEAANGYTCILNTLELCTKTGVSQAETVLRCVYSLAFIGPVPLHTRIDTLTIISGSPFQHKNFALPSPGNGSLVRNLNFISLFTEFLKPESFAGLDAERAEAREQISCMLLDTLLDILKSESLNYYIFTSSDLFARLVNSFDLLPEKVKIDILSILTFVLLELNFVPFKEIALILVQYQRAQSESTVKLLCEFLIATAADSERYLDVFREVGILNLFIKTINAFAVASKTYPETLLPLDPSQQTVVAFEIQLSESHIINFGFITDVLVNFIRNSQNQTLFRLGTNRALYDCLQNDRLQQDAIKLVRILQMQEMDKIVENPEESPIFHLSNVLHYPNVTPAAQIQILKLLRESLDMSITAQMFFKEINGLNALISLPLREIDSSFMNAWISTIISAIKGFKNYIDNDKFIKLSSQLPESYQTLFLGGYLAIALENTGFINLFHEFENVSSKELSQDFFDYIDDLVQSKMPRNRPYLVNPEILAVFPAYLDLILSKKGALECYPIVLVLYNITTSCTRNLSACHSGSFVLRLLEFSFKVLLRPDENLQLQALVGKYIRRLFDSETKTEYLRCLFSQLELLPQNSLTNRAIVTDLIQYALNRPRTPDFIHFEAENNPCHGYIKIDDYERPFPPQYGYSLVTWIKIDTIDPSHDVQIMTIIDAEDSVRLSLSFGAQSRQLSLQTMKSTVILESVTLEKNVWYHLALVHLKPMLSASTLKVFLNGKFADMVQCGYMGHPGGSSAVSTFFGSASQSGLRISGHSWNLGPTLFLEEILLEPKAISYMFQNSYEFQGNWQGVILDSKHLPPSTSDPVEESTGIIDPVSTITSIVFAAPSTISDIVGFKEDKILLSLHPGTETRRLTKEYAAEPLSTIKQVARSLTSSSKSLLCLTRPSLISSDTPQAGKTFGDLICCPTENIYNAVWRIGGPAIFLYLVETSTTSGQLESALAMLSVVLHSSRRNLKDMKRFGYYEMLLGLLREKKLLLEVPVMQRVTDLVFWDHKVTEGEAFRHIFLDLELWNSKEDIQSFLVDKLGVVFISGHASKENMKLVFKSSCIKRFLNIMSSNNLKESVISKFVDVLQAFVLFSFSVDCVRNLSSFLLTTLPQGECKNDKENAYILQFPPFGPASDAALYRVKIRNTVLQSLINAIMLNVGHVSVFLSALSPQWVLNFCGPHLDPVTVAFSLHLFVRLWSKGENVAYDSNNSQRFVIIAHALREYHDITPIYFAVLSLLFGKDKIPAGISFDFPSLLAVFKPNGGSKSAMVPDAFQVVLALIRSSTDFILKEHQNLERPESDSIRYVSGITWDVDTKPDIMYFEDSTYLWTAAQNNQALLQFIFSMFTQIDEFKEVLTRQNHIDDLVCLLYRVVEMSKHPIAYSVNSLGASAESLKHHSSSKYCQVIIDSLLDLILAVGTDAILGNWNPWTGLDLILKTVPTPLYEEYIIFQTWMLSKLIDQISNKLKGRKSYFTDPKVLSNLSRFLDLIVDRIYSGHFNTNLIPLHDLIATVIHSFSESETTASLFIRPDIGMHLFYRPYNRLIIFCFGDHSETTSRLSNSGLIYAGLQNNKLILSAKNNDLEFFKAFIHQMFSYLSSDIEECSTLAKLAWPAIIQRKSMQLTVTLKAINPEYQKLVDVIMTWSKQECETFQGLLTGTLTDISSSIQEALSRQWNSLIENEKKQADERFAAMNVFRNQKHKSQAKYLSDKASLWRVAQEKMGAWVQHVQMAAKDRRIQLNQDLSTIHTLVLTDWKEHAGDMLRERGIWGPTDELDKRWKLDFNEGKNRMRIKTMKNSLKLKYKSKEEKVKEDTSKKEKKELLETVEKTLILSMQKAKNAEPQTVTEDSGAPKSTSVTEAQSKTDSGIPGEQDEVGDEWEELNVSEDQNLQVTRLLENGDDILEVYNGSIISGIDVCDCLIVSCAKSIYVIDNFYRRESGEIVDVKDLELAERNIYTSIINSDQGYAGENSSGRKWHHKRRCLLEDLKEVYKRSYLFRNVALEIFLNDGRNYLLVFVSKRERNAFYNKLQRVVLAATEESQVVNVISKGTGMLSNIISGNQFSDVTQKWVIGEMSNFAYLMYLNTLAGRTYNDLTQYPVFPWIISDYTSSTLNLNDSKIYRDLSKPMGAQGSKRANQFQERFELWDDPVIPACHYGTHYSSAMIVCSYLIRLEPFTQQYLQLQGGYFDHADRLFHSIAYAYDSAAALNTTDVKELIPEFFYLPDFLENRNRFDLGVKQTGETLNDIVLPPWAEGNPRLFIQKNREALESPYVSERLHEWIDLIFGYKQKGEDAEKALNIFHYLSYEGAVELDQIQDDVERQATIGIINNFGQTPQQMFTKPHPKKIVDTKDKPLWIHDDPKLLMCSCQPLKTLPRTGVQSVRYVADKIIAAPSCCVLSPNGQKYLKWDLLDKSLRLCLSDSNKCLAIYEHLHPDHITACVFVTNDVFVTGGNDGIVCLWSLTLARPPKVEQLGTFRGHIQKVVHLAVSKSFSTIVSCGLDSFAILWDLNRKKYVRSLNGHEGPVVCCAINDQTGDILTCTHTFLRLWTLNGDLILEQSIPDPISCCAFYEGLEYNVFGSNLIFTGHEKGHVKVWKLLFDKAHSNPWRVSLEVTLKQSEPSSAISCLYFPGSQRFLLSGNVAGQVFGFFLPDGSGTDVQCTFDDSCAQCQTKFAVLERKCHCKACGLTLCATCLGSGAPTVFGSGKVCRGCFQRLSAAPPK